MALPALALLLTITAQNYGQYEGQLSAGHRALFAKYPDFQMQVHQTSPPPSFPRVVVDAASQNRGRARLKGADAIEGASLGIPFPDPRSGVEVMWNHRLRYRGDSQEWRYTRACVIAGTPEITAAYERVLAGYANASAPSPDMHSWTFLQLENAEHLGAYNILWHDPLNLLESPRRIWGGSHTNRTYRAPPLGYDQVGLFSYHIRYFDMVDMFNGGFDRYSWKLVGAQERYVPYDSTGARDGSRTVEQLVGPHFIDPDALRYELRRVWIVEATQRPGQHHPLARRVFYVDPQSWSILLVEGYDASGELSRFQEGHLLPLPEVQAVDLAPVVTYDLPGDRYFADRLLAGSPSPRLNPPMRDSDFLPSLTQRRFPAPASRLTPASTSPAPAPAAAPTTW